MPLYLDRVQTPVSFDRSDLERYKAEAEAQRITFSEWINKLCARAVKPMRDNRRKARGE